MNPSLIIQIGWKGIKFPGRCGEVQCWREKKGLKKFKVKWREVKVTHSCLTLCGPREVPGMCPFCGLQGLLACRHSHVRACFRFHIPSPYAFTGPKSSYISSSTVAFSSHTQAIYQRFTTVTDFTVTHFLDCQLKIVSAKQMFVSQPTFPWTPTAISEVWSTDHKTRTYGLNTTRGTNCTLKRRCTVWLWFSLRHLQEKLVKQGINYKECSKLKVYSFFINHLSGLNGLFYWFFSMMNVNWLINHSHLKLCVWIFSGNLPWAHGAALTTSISPEPSASSWSRHPDLSYAPPSLNDSAGHETAFSRLTSSSAISHIYSWNYICFCLFLPRVSPALALPPVGSEVHTFIYRIYRAKY